MSKLNELIQKLCPDGVEYKKLAECCTLEKGNTPIQKAVPGEYPLVVTTEERKSSNTYQFEKPTVCIPLISSRGHGVASLNSLFYQEGRFALGNILCGVTPINGNELSAKFLFHYLNHKKDTLIVPLMRGGANVSLTVDSLKKVKVPVPPMLVQNEIVGVFDKFEALGIELMAELTARKKQYEYYRNNVLTFGSNVRVERLGDSCNMKSGKAISTAKVSAEQTEATPYECFGGNGVRGYVATASHHGEFPIIGRQGALCGNVNYASGDFYATEHAVVVESKGAYLQRFLYYLLSSMNLNQYKSQGAQPGLAVGNLENLTAPIPSIKEQERIVSVLESFNTICNDLSTGLPAEIEARRKQYEYYRDKFLSFKEVGKC